jgi:glycine dehydrogenase subunit 1
LSYISNTETDRAEMMTAIGINQFDELLAPIPVSARLDRPLNLPPALDEYTLVRHLQSLAARNADLEANLCFLGAGIYDHFRPSVVAALQSRGEFLTSYTPYQPEVSQGMLQAIYEYQSLICGLTAMDISNASMYDAATGLAEAALMATSVTDRTEIVCSRAVHPHYRQVLATYAASTGYTVVDVPLSGFSTDPDAIEAAITERTACVIAQQPSFFGYLDAIGPITEAAHRVGALSIVAADPVSLGLLTPPGEHDVDVVVGEGQSLGSPMGFGGPLLGFFACKKKYARSFPGRVVGATLDAQGRRGYTMTLRTREQDIRRERATSNICTNQALIALAATIYLCELGKTGLRDVANLCLQKAHYAQSRLTAVPGVSAVHAEAKFFKEFVVHVDLHPEELNRRLLAHKIVGGLPLSGYYGEMENAMLVCVTETKSKEDIDRFATSMAACLERGA